VGLAVQHTVHGRVAAHLQPTNALYITRFAASEKLLLLWLAFTQRWDANKLDRFSMPWTTGHYICMMHTYREDPLAVAALEACLVVDDAVGREEVDEMDGLVARRALVLRAGERHGADACGCTHALVAPNAIRNRFSPPLG
jgi:hypothetical protein